MKITIAILLAIILAVFAGALYFAHSTAWLFAITAAGEAALAVFMVCILRSEDKKNKK